MTAAEISSARAAAGLSLYDVPRRMPVSIVRWYRIEQGLETPTESELRDFAQVVNKAPAAAST